MSATLQTPREWAGQKLKDWRLAQGLTQQEAAAALGVSQAAWCDWERGMKTPLLSSALEIELLTGGACPAKIFRIDRRRTIVLSVWKSMRARCENPRSNRYKDYGARGIYVCRRWHDFEAFYADVGPRPRNRGPYRFTSYSIDRINNDGGYTCGKCPQCRARGAVSNCKWSTAKQQASNTGRTRRGVSREAAA